MGHFHQMGFVWASYCGALRSQFDLSGLSQTSVTPKSEDTRWFKGDVIMVVFLSSSQRCITKSDGRLLKVT